MISAPIVSGKPGQAPSLTQADSIWPIHAKAFQDYFAVTVTMGGQSDERTLKAISALAGEYMRRYDSSSESFTAGVSESTSETRTTSGSQASTSSGLSFGWSSSSTSGYSVSYRKERRLSEADIASLEPGCALVMAHDGWQMVDLVGIRSRAWRAAAGPCQDVVRHRRLAIGSSSWSPVLPPVDELVDDAERKHRRNDESGDA